jgi:hypothetical protein
MEKKIHRVGNRYLKVADRIKEITGVNIFENKRTLQIVDARATACYIYNKYYNGTLHEIANFFKDNGKNYDHSSVYYNIQLFEEVKQRRKDIDKNLSYLIGSIDCNTQLNIVIDTILSNDDKERIINIVNRLVNKYQNKNNSVI